tara:strand:+ start:1033 stop:1251 length:219 start_codon:yes stop_codon:yes gene_type:complete
MEAIVGLMAKMPEWLVAVSGVVTACTAVTALTPTKVDDKAFGMLTKFINLALKVANVGAGNILKNENKDSRK